MHESYLDMPQVQLRLPEQNPIIAALYGAMAGAGVGSEGAKETLPHGLPQAGEDSYTGCRGLVEASCKRMPGVTAGSNCHSRDPGICLAWSAATKCMSKPYANPLVKC